MNTVTDERLQDLVRLVNNRLREFGPDVFPVLSWGVVRLMLGAVREWDDEDSSAERAAIEREQWQTDIHDTVFTEGWQAGRESIRREMAIRAALPQPDSTPNGFGLECDENGIVRERAPWQTDPTPTPLAAEPAAEPDMTADDVEAARMAAQRRLNGWDGVGDDVSELADAWPTMPDLTGGIDRFAEYPVAGELDDEDAFDEAISKLGPPVRITPIAPKPIGPTRADSELDRVRDHGKPALPEPDVAREQLATALAEANGDGGNIVSLINRKPRTLAEVDRGKPKGRPKGRRGNVLPTVDELVAEVKRQAMGGVMPTLAQFNQSKPGNWATATAHLQRLGISWDQLRRRAGLKVNPRAA